MPSGYKGPRDNDPPLRRSGAQGADNRPSDDLRVQPFTDDVFSEYQARRKENSGSPLGLIAGVAIGVAAVAGIGWYMYSSGALTGSGTGTGGGPQLVQADPDPYKVKPASPGGMKVENQDKLVYERVAKGEAPPRVENLLPAPEEPKAPPKPVAPPPEAAKPEPAPAETAKAEPAKPEVLSGVAKPDAAKTEAAKPEVARPEAAKPEAAKPEPAKEVAKAEPAKPAAPAKPEQDDLAAAVMAATGGREAATGPLTAKPAAPAASEPQVAAAPPAPAPATPPAAPAAASAATPAAPSAAAAGGFQIQLASARSEQGAMGEWSRIVGKNKDALGGLTPSVARVDLGEKGVFFRLRAGPLADRAAAESLCATLSAQNVGCIVVRP